MDRNGKVRAKFGLGTEGSPTLALRNKEGELGFVYSLAQQGSPTDQPCRTRTARSGRGSSLAAEGSPILRLLNKDGELRADTWPTAPARCPEFMDAGGRPLVTAPGPLATPAAADAAQEG